MARGVRVFLESPRIIWQMSAWWHRVHLEPAPVEWCGGLVVCANAEVLDQAFGFRLAKAFHAAVPKMPAILHSKLR